MRVFAIALGIATLLITSCGANVFACDEDVDCAGSGASGLCESNGYCSFPDEMCDSGRRYGDRGPAGIGGTCVPVGGEETGDGTGTTVASTTMNPSGSSTDVASSSEASASTQAVEDSSAGSPTTADPSSSGGSSSSPTSTGSEPFVVEVPATLAVCTEVGVFDTVHCAIEAGDDEFTIDSEDVDGYVCNAWLRFDLDDTLEGAEILSVELVLRVGSDMFDESGQSGELWLASPFDLGSLGMADPTLTELVSGDLGAVAVDADVTFDVAPDLVAPNEAIHFGLIPILTDGLDYLGHTSAIPPRLVVQAQSR